MINAGQIIATAAAAVDLFRGGTVLNAGLIAGGTLLGHRPLALAGDVNNSGTLTSGPTGVYVMGAAGTIVNSGLMHQVGLNAGGSVTNQAGGTIIGTLVGLSNYSGVYITGGAPGTLVNYGLVTNSGGYAVNLRPGRHDHQLWRKRPAVGRDYSVRSGRHFLA